MSKYKNGKLLMEQEEGFGEITWVFHVRDIGQVTNLGEEYGSQRSLPLGNSNKLRSKGLADVNWARRRRGQKPCG